MRVANFTLAATLDGVSALALAAYLVAVVYQGNVKPLGSALLKDGPGFLEFVIALYIITLLVNVRGPVGDIMTAFIVLAAIVVVMRLMGGSGLSAFKAFGEGQISIFELVKKLATN